MAVKRIKDLAVKVGTYTVNGEQKNRYKNVGSLMKSDDGSVFIFLDRSFNPAGVPVDPEKSDIIVSVFDIRDENKPQAQTAARQAPQQSNATMDDNVPF